MKPELFTLFNIVWQNEKAQFEISVISFEIGEPLNHTLTINYQPIGEWTPKKTVRSTMIFHSRCSLNLK